MKILPDSESGVPELRPVILFSFHSFGFQIFPLWDHLSHSHDFGLWDFVLRYGLNLPAMQETYVQSLDQEDPLEKGTGTHSSILARRIPWTEEPSGLHSLGSPRVGHARVTETHTCGWPASVCLQWDSKLQSFHLAGLLPLLETQMQPVSVVPPRLHTHTQERGWLLPRVYVSSSACSLRLEKL